MLWEVFQRAAQQRLIPEITVGAVMTPDPFVISPDCSAKKLIGLFHEKQFRHFLVADKSRLLGIISDRDVIPLFGAGEAMKPKCLDKITASELMSTGLITVVPTAYLAQAVTLMLDHGVNSLPVVKGQQLVGIVTSTDVFLSLEQLLLSVFTIHGRNTPKTSVRR